jgi:hypothetical protein
MTCEPSSGMSGIGKLCLPNQYQREIVDGSHDISCLTDGHASRIFFQSDIQAIMQAGFNPPMGKSDIQLTRGIGLLACQVGNAKFHFTRGSIAFSIAPSFKQSLQTVDLRQARPPRVGIEHFTGDDRTRFYTTMVFGYLLNA